MQRPEILLPLILLGLSFGLKLFIDRSAKTLDVIHAICELPVDIIFLALSFAVADAISRKVSNANGLEYCFGGVLIAIVVLVVWRKCLHFLSSYSNWKKFIWLPLLLFNMLLSGYCLKISVDLIKEGKKKSKYNPVLQNQDSASKINRNQ